MNFQIRLLYIPLKVHTFFPIKMENSPLEEKFAHTHMKWRIRCGRITQCTLGGGGAAGVYMEIDGCVRRRGCIYPSTHPSIQPASPHAEGAGASWAANRGEHRARTHVQAERIFAKAGAGVPREEKWKKESACGGGWSSHTHDVTPACCWKRCKYFSYLLRAGAGSGAERERERDANSFFFIFHTQREREREEEDGSIPPANICVCCFPLICMRCIWCAHRSHPRPPPQFALSHLKSNHLFHPLSLLFGSLSRSLQLFFICIFQ